MPEEENKIDATEEEAEPKKTFSWGEIVLVSLIVGSVDFLTIAANLAALVPVVGEVAEGIGSFTGGATTLAIQFYLSMKGVKNLWFLIGGTLDSIPIINTLPTETIGWLIVVIMENNPKLKKVAEKADKTGVGKIAGKI